MTRFVKNTDPNSGRFGGWEFRARANEARKYMAIRNQAGFAGRDWELWELAESGEWVCVEDQLASRGECVVFAQYGYIPYKA